MKLLGDKNINDRSAGEAIEKIANSLTLSNCSGDDLVAGMQVKRGMTQISQAVLETDGIIGGVIGLVGAETPREARIKEGTAAITKGLESVNSRMDAVDKAVMFGEALTMGIERDISK